MKRRLFRRARAGLAVLIAVACAAALAAAPAWAGQTHDFLGTVGEGELSEATGIAVASGSGDLLVADRGGRALRRFAPDGTPAPFSVSGESTLGPLAIPAKSLSPVAVDNSAGSGAADGDIYVVTANSVRAYKASGAPALFADQSSYALGSSIEGNPFGPFEAVSAVSVDFKGAIYVSALESGGQETVSVYSPQGEYLTQINASNSVGLASEPKGVLYASSTAFELTNGYTPETYPVESGTNFGSPSYPALPAPHGVAVDPESSDLFINAGSKIAEFTSSEKGNEPVATFGADQLEAGGSSALAVDGSSGANTGDVYVANGTRVDRFGPLVNAPDVVTEPAAANSATATATLNGTIDSDGEAITGCVFEYGTTPALGETAPCAETAAEIENGPAPFAVHADLTGLEVANYSFRLRAAGPEGSADGAKLSFAISGAPAVNSEAAQPSSVEGMRLASLSSGNLAATYHFEYGLTGDYGSSTPTGSIPASPAPKDVATAIAGLIPGTTYHFRAVVTNGDGTGFGPDQTFTTTLPGASSGCPNEALRQGLSALLPECRAYELVSPADKEGGQVFGSLNSQPAPGGGRIAFLSDSAFAGAEANVLLGAYVSNRSEGGGGSWSTAASDPPGYNEAGLVEVTTIAFDSNLDKALQISRRALAPGAIEGGTNIYVRDLETRSWTTLKAFPNGSLFQGLNSRPALYAGGTADWSHVYLRFEHALTNEAPEGAEELYESNGSGLKVVSRLPDGTVPPEGIFAGVAPDGSRAFFHQGGLNPGLYVTEPGAPSRLIAHSHQGGPANEEQPSEAVTFAGASSDGSVAYFSGAEGLVAGSGEHGSMTLYRWQSNGDRLEEVTPVAASEPEGPAVSTLGSAVSADGSYVYFRAGAALAKGASPVAAPGYNLYVWHEGDIRFVARNEDLTNESAVGQVSPNGLHYATPAFTALTPEVTPGGSCPESESCSNVFVYDYQTDSLRCASCSGGPGAGNSFLGGQEEGPLDTMKVISAVLDDGQVFFQTPNSLVPRDSNAQVDVYQWNGSSAQLISSGTSEAGSLYAGASLDGRDVYIKTYQQLVTADTDRSFDIYDARAGGGIGAQNATTASPCEAEACRGASPAPPPSASAASGCGELSGLARRTGARAKALTRRAHRTNGRAAKKLRHRAAAERKQAKKLRTKTNQCRRQAR